MAKKKQPAKPEINETAKPEFKGRFVVRQNDTNNFLTRNGVFSDNVEDRAEFMTYVEAEQLANDHKIKSDMVTVEEV